MVWAFVQDPERVARCLPDVQEVVVQDANHMEATVQVGVGMVRGKFKFKIEVRPDQDAGRVNVIVRGGGLGSVRGFEQSSLGVTDPTGAFIGGARKLNVNAELYFPVPGTGNDKSLRIFAFADAGNVWRETEKMTASSLRSSAGVGLSWIIPDPRIERVLAEAEVEG